MPRYIEGESYPFMMSAHYEPHMFDEKTFVMLPGVAPVGKPAWCAVRYPDVQMHQGHRRGFQRYRQGDDAL